MLLFLHKLLEFPRAAYTGVAKQVTNPARPGPDFDFAWGVLTKLWKSGSLSSVSYVRCALGRDMVQVTGPICCCCCIGMLGPCRETFRASTSLPNVCCYRPPRAQQRRFRRGPCHPCASAATKAVARLTSPSSRRVSVAPTSSEISKAE